MNALRHLLDCPGFGVSVSAVSGGAIIRGSVSELRTSKRLILRFIPGVRVKDVPGGIMVTKWT